MRYAVMSDVHANPQALERALADARAQGCETFFMLGDTTGYGYDVVRALALVRANFDRVLMGNHDSACLGRETRPEALENPNYDIDRAQSRELSPEDRRWFTARPFVLRAASAVFVHGELTRPRAWNYMLDENAARVNFAALAPHEQVLFCGHTHHAAAWSLSPRGRVYAKYERRLEMPTLRAESISFRLKPGWRYVVNVGSVGYPRVDFCSVYAIYDPERHQITYRRLPFDFKHYIDSMIARGLPLPWWLEELLARAARRMKLPVGT